MQNFRIDKSIHINKLDSYPSVMVLPLVKGVSKLFNRPKFAYDLEDQMFGVVDAQKGGRLLALNHTIDNVVLKRENNQRWYVINGGDPTFYEGHCTEYILDLKKGDTLITIAGDNVRPDILDGKSNYCVGLALDSKGRIVYKSPGYSYPELTP